MKKSKKNKIKRYKISTFRSVCVDLDIEDSLYNVVSFVIVSICYPFIWMYGKVNNIIYDYVHKNMNDEDTDD